jgi:hypothetical protein
MITRDPLFDADHFERIIADEKAELAKWEKYGPDTGCLLTIMIAMYSAGYPLDQVRQAYVEYLVAVANRTVKSPPSPSNVMHPMVFALMMGVEAGEREMLAVIAAKDDNDEPFQALLEETLGLEHPPVGKKKTLWKFFPEVSTIEDKADKEAFIAHYLKKSWYNSNRNEGWWGTHQRGGAYYSGYWAWEIGGLVKAYGLDDTELKDVKYYPWDMAHYLDAS